MRDWCHRRGVGFLALNGLEEGVVQMVGHKATEGKIVYKEAIWGKLLLYIFFFKSDMK